MAQPVIREHVTNRATRTINGAGTPLRGARYLNVTCYRLVLSVLRTWWAAFHFMCVGAIFSIFVDASGCGFLANARRFSPVLLHISKQFFCRLAPMGGNIAYDVSLGFGRVCGKLRVRKNLLSRTTKTIRSKLVIRLLAEEWFRRQYCFALCRCASVFWMSPIAIPCQACDMG